MNEKYQYFNGLKFTRDDKTGYYLNSTIRKRIHRYVWEFYHGEIPKGYHIHHIDGDKSNNDISNLKMVEGQRHVSRHSEKWHEENPKQTAEIIEKMQTSAKEWHKSKQGKEWHKAHYENDVREKLHPEQIKKCQCCGKEFVSRVLNGKYCSGRCKVKYGRMIKRAKEEGSLLC